MMRPGESRHTPQTGNSGSRIRQIRATCPVGRRAPIESVDRNTFAHKELGKAANEESESILTRSTAARHRDNHPTDHAEQQDGRADTAHEQEKRRICRQLILPSQSPAKRGRD